MKRFGFLLIAVLLTSEVSHAKTYKIFNSCARIKAFDIDRDGRVNGRDLYLGYRASVGDVQVLAFLAELNTPEQILKLDVNGDSVLDKKDIDIVQRYVLGANCR